MLFYRTESLVLVRRAASGPYYWLPDLEWDQLFTDPTVARTVSQQVEAGTLESLDDLSGVKLLPPIGSQEVWAAGVTYLRSRTARMEESAAAGGSDFYDLVYHATRPELFFKATAHRVVGDGGVLRLRSDSRWIVPEPELTLAFRSDGAYLGFTIGNDLSCRDIEAENPLYLPQAKMFDRCAALGPALWISNGFPGPETQIQLSIHRGGQEAFAGSTQISQMKQTFPNLQEHLWRDNTFPDGCYLMTGTGIVPPDDFSLQSGDQVSISIEPIGTLINTLQ